jgi:hypothetical protein
MDVDSTNPLKHVALLLADPSPCLRYRVLDELFEARQDEAMRPELLELAELRQDDPLLAGLLRLQEDDGSWRTGVLGDPLGGGRLQATGLALARLAFLGLERSHPAVQRAAQFLFDQQQPDGSWPLVRDGVGDDVGSEGYAMMPLQTAHPLRGLAACGYASDPRCERAYDWLLAQRLPDGAWPTGVAKSGVYGYVAGYRRLAHSRWGCRSNTTGALICLSLHPERRRSPEAQRGLDLLLGRETRERQALGFETARLVGAEPARGFITFYARFDLALILHLCWQVGARVEDPRVDDIVKFVLTTQNAYGLWEYQPRPQASRWVTFDLLRSLQGLEANSRSNTAWLSLEPRTPFQPYPKKDKRY